MKKVVALLTKSSQTQDTVINSYADQASKDLYLELVQPISTEISKKKMEVLSIKESISLVTDVNAGLRKMSYEDIKKSLSRIVALNAEIAVLEEDFSYIQESYYDLFGEQVFSYSQESYDELFGEDPVEKACSQE